VKNPGTYKGLIEKIPYLKELGITAVELLPICEFDETHNGRKNPITGERLVNYWGYNSICFHAPKASYSSQGLNGEQIFEFKSLVKALHTAGIEVILDVVFNHTGEEDEQGPVYTFRGIDNPIYYMIDKKTRGYHDFTGCGNTVNCNHPVVRDLIMDCLRYWVIEMHVDGFRFDLASVLCRAEDGSVLANPPLVERITKDPVLANTKLIAEPWDAGGLYQLGSFPAGKKWAEWNDKYRNHIRKYIRGDRGMIPKLATRIAGSSDLYRMSARTPYHSINFITCHDGFTLADLVSYKKKHNQMNGESNRDGLDENFSRNYGKEGPSENPRINRLRKRQIKNMALLLMLSQGVPMLLAGDEMGRSQRGNNNAYCQDNEISWIDWNLLEQNAELVRFFKLAIQFRKHHSTLRRTTFFEDDPSGKILINWYDKKLKQPNWAGKSCYLAFHLLPDQINKRDIFVISNASPSSQSFQLPALETGKIWRRSADTYLDSPYDICETGKEQALKEQGTYDAHPQSTVVLIA
jgi:glycogen operon protein